MTKSYEIIVISHTEELKGLKFGIDLSRLLILSFEVEASGLDQYLDSLKPGLKNHGQHSCLYALIIFTKNRKRRNRLSQWLSCPVKLILKL